MDEETRAVHNLVQEVNQNRLEEARFLKEINRYTNLLRGLIVFLVLVALGALGMVLYTIRNTYPSLVANAIFIAQLVFLFAASFLVSNWLRVFFQNKIDHANTRIYGNGWSKG